MPVPWSPVFCATCTPFMRKIFVSEEIFPCAVTTAETGAGKLVVVAQFPAVPSLNDANLFDALKGAAIEKFPCGNGIHATQSTSSARPLWQEDTNGKPGLKFDGVNNFLVTSSIGCCY